MTLAPAICDEKFLKPGEIFLQVLTPVTDKCWNTSTVAAILLVFWTAPTAGYSHNFHHFHNLHHFLLYAHFATHSLSNTVIPGFNNNAKRLSTFQNFSTFSTLSTLPSFTMCSELLFLLRTQNIFKLFSNLQKCYIFQLCHRR